MNDLDQWLSALGDDASYGDDAATRLEQRLTGQPSPRASARRRRRAASIAFVCVASVAGAATGAVLELRPAPAAASILPAAQTGTAAALLFGEG